MALTQSLVINDKKIDQFGYKVTFYKKTNKSATQVGFTTYVRYFRLYESLMSKFMYIEGIITDGGGMVQRLGIQPGDVLEIELYKDPSDSVEEKISKEFVIEQLGGQNRTDGQKASRYSFRAVSAIGYEGIKNKIKKSFKGKAKDIVLEIANTYLAAPPAMINTSNFTDTSGDIVYNAASLSPFETIENVCIQSVASDNPKDANFFFYETRDSLNFKSLKKIVSSANAFVYVLKVDKNRDDVSASNDYFRIQDITHHNSTDQRQKLKDGVLKNKTVSFNFISRKVEETTFDLKKDYKDILVMGDYLLMDDEEIDNFVGDTSRTTDEEPNIFVRCSQECYDQVVDNKIQSRPFAKAQRGLMNQTVVTIKIHGNPKLRPGDIIELKVPQASGHKKEERDFILSGKFLIGSAAHTVTDANNYVTVCDLFKDGYERNITDYRKDINSHLVRERV